MSSSGCTKYDTTFRYGDVDLKLFPHGDREETSRNGFFPQSGASQVENFTTHEWATAPFSYPPSNHDKLTRIMIDIVDEAIDER